MPSLRSKARDASGAVIDPTAVYVCHESHCRVDPATGADVIVSQGERRLGSDELVQRASSLWYRDGDRVPPASHHRRAVDAGSQPRQT